MSIVSSSFKGWDYQHITSLYIALHYLVKYEVISITIDAPGTEDCQIRFREKGIAPIQVAEIQCKNYKPSLEEVRFAEFMTHFENRSASTNLLSKLADGKINRVHLVYRSRAADFAARLNLLPDSDTLDEKDIELVAQKYLKLFGNAIKKVLANSTSELDIKRHDYNQQLARHLLGDNTLFRQVLKNVFITDQLTQAKAEREIQALLQQNFKVPAGSALACFSNLAALVKKSADSTTNILADILKILSKHKAGGISTVERYLPRENEDDLLQTLREERVLLLTGNSRCGKTQLAKQTAAKLLATTGISHLQTGDPDEANRYLTESTTEEKLCLLEDPFGQYPGEAGTMLYKHFENLLSNLPPHPARYLVVTSRTEVVEYSSLTRHLQWKAVNVMDRVFLKALWEQLAGQFNPGLTLNNTVLAILENDPLQNLLQPGELSFLARNFLQITSTDPESVRHFARSTAQDIAQLVSRNKRSYVELFIILGLTASTLNGPCKEDLQYLLAGNKEYLPGVFKARAISYGISSPGKENSYTIPQYLLLPPLSAEVTAALEDMIEKGYIIEAGSCYLFSHPVYQESARNFLKQTAHSAFSRNLSYICSSIACLNPAVALNTIRSLYLFWGFHSTDPGRTTEITKVAFEAQHSIFLSVQDSSQLFILGKYEWLDVDSKKEVHEWLMKGHAHTYYWDRGIAFVPPVADRRYIPDFEEKFMTEEGFLERLAARNEGRDTSSRNAWLIIHYLGIETRHRKLRVSYDPDFLSSFLSHDESFIREAASYLLAASITAPFFTRLSNLLRAGDPLVVFQLIKGAVWAYPYLKDKQEKDKLLGMLLDAYDNPMVVIRSIPFMTQYDSGHSRNTFDWRDDIAPEIIPDMWEVWAELMPVFFRHVTPVTFINEGRFSAALNESYRQVSQARQFRIIESWTDWLQRQESLSFRNPFVLTLFEHFMGLFESYPLEERFRITSLLLNLSCRPLVIRLVNELIYRYTYLTDTEQNYLSAFLSRADEASQNVALVSRGADQGIQGALTGYGELGSVSTTQLIEVLSEKRLKTCLFLLFPSYNYSELEYPDTAAWRKHLLYFLAYPEHPLFLLAVNRIIYEWQHPTDYINELKANRKSLLESVLKKPDRNRLEEIFTLLLTGLTETKERFKILFILFFMNIRQEEREFFGKRLGEYVESISYADALEEIPRSVYLEFIAPLLKGEREVERIMYSVNIRLANGIRPHASEINLLETHLREGGIRNYTTADDLADLLNEYPYAFPDHLTGLVSRVRNDIFGKYEAQNKQLQERITDIFSSLETEADQ